MIRRRHRPDMPFDPAPFVRSLRVARTSIIELSTVVRPYCDVGRAAGAILVSIDSLAELLTGDPAYFWDQGSRGFGSTDDLLAEKIAREDGHKPWR